MKEFNLEEQRIIRALYKAGKSICYIASQINASKMEVLEFLHKNKIPRPPEFFQGK